MPSRDDAAPPADRVQRRKDATRARLIAAATTLIAGDGVDSLRLRRITDEADIAGGAFYNYFSSKEELVEAVVGEAIAALTASTIRLLQAIEDPAEAVSVAHRWFVRQAVVDPRMAWLLVHLDRANTFVLEAVTPFSRDLLGGGIATGRFDDMDVDVAITHAVSTTIGAMRAVLEHDAPPESAQQSAELLLRAFGVAPAEARRIAQAPMPDLQPEASRG